MEAKEAPLFSVDESQWDWSFQYPEVVPEVQRQQHAAEGLLRRLYGHEQHRDLMIWFGSSTLWGALHEVDDGGELRKFDPESVRNYLDQFASLMGPLLPDQHALIAELEQQLARYPEG